jgi:ATP-dependent Clp protease ATP-binding subunit ClpB
VAHARGVVVQDPVIGRDDEIRRTIQILSRRSKNNPVLIGAA